MEIYQVNIFKWRRRMKDICFQKTLCIDWITCECWQSSTHRSELKKNDKKQQKQQKTNPILFHCHRKHVWRTMRMHWNRTCLQMAYNILVYTFFFIISIIRYIVIFGLVLFLLSFFLPPLLSLALICTFTCCLWLCNKVSHERRMAKDDH